MFYLRSFCVRRFVTDLFALCFNHTHTTHVQEAPKSMLDDDADLLDGVEDAELL